MPRRGPLMSYYACRSCKAVFALSPEQERKCPVCGSTDISNDWSGLVVIIDTSSALAELLKISKPGKYALKVR